MFFKKKSCLEFSTKENEKAYRKKSEEILLRNRQACEKRLGELQRGYKEDSVEILASSKTKAVVELLELYRSLR